MKSFGYLSASAANVLYPLFFTLCTVAALIGFVWLMIRYIGKKDEVVQSADGQEARPVAPNFAGLLLLMLTGGLILRLIFAFVGYGYRPDTMTVTRMFDALSANGFGKSYYADNGTLLFPVTYYIYALFGALVKLFGIGHNTIMLAFFIKLPLIIADLVTACLLYRIARKYVNGYVAVTVAGFVCVFPLFIFASSVWATQYSLLAMFTVLSFMFMAEKNFVATTGCYAATLLCHKDAIYLFPLFAVFLIYNLVKACMQLKGNKVSFRALLADPNLRPVFTIPVSIVGFLPISYLVSLPLMIGSFGAGFFTFLYRLYFKPLGSIGIFGHNALSIFNVFMRNGRELNTRFPTVVFVVLFAVIITGIVLLVYLSKKNRANLVYLGGYIVLTLGIYFIGFSEFGLLSATVLLLMAFLLIRDKRILSVLLLLSLPMMLNAACVMSSANFYNTLPEYDVANASTLLSGAGGTAVSIICSVIAVLSHLYATFVLLDISMSDKRKLLPYAPHAGFADVFKLYFRREKNN